MSVFNGLKRSLSARRAWIEIGKAETAKTSNAVVALRKESVDRNLKDESEQLTLDEVALRKESVDRNMPGQNLINGIGRRSPQGERG